jgi:hypothetical protein
MLEFQGMRSDCGRKEAVEKRRWWEGACRALAQGAAAAKTA